MATTAAPSGEIHYDLHDMTPPWREAPETIVFHHGVGTTGGIWSDWLPVLAGRFRLLAFDLPGFGRSPAPGEGYRWTLEGMMADLMAVADAAGIERFHLVGESAGGTVALHTAVNSPERLLSVTGVSCAHRGNAIQRVAEWWDQISGDGLAAWSAEMMRLRFHEGEVDDDVLAWFEAAQSAGDARAVLGIARMLVAADLSAKLPEITLPVLLLAPDGSPFVAPPITAEMHSLVPGAELEIFAHARHGLACSHGEACAECLYDFLTRRAEAAQRRLQCEEHTP